MIWACTVTGLASGTAPGVRLGPGKAEIVSWTYVETAPNSDITQYIALAPWVEKNRATAEKFARAVIKGAQFANANEAATRDINQQFTGLNPALKDTVLLPRFGTAVNVGETTRTMELMRAWGGDATLANRPEGGARATLTAPRFAGSLPPASYGGHDA